MTCNRWEEIKRHLHFNDNTKFIRQGLHGHDKLFKVRPLIEAIRKQLLLVPKEEYLAVDEQIIPTKARHTLKQYNPKKPKKWGYKNLVLCGSSGFSYDFDIFAGEQSNTVPEGAPNIGASGNIVIKLTDSVPRHKNYNWFNSIKLQVYLSKIGLLSLGTARTNRITDSTMPSEKEFKKRGRGSMAEQVATVDGVDVGCVCWYDNKLVTMLSSYVGTSPVTQRRRFFRKDHEYRDIPCPKAIDIYIINTWGV